MAGAPGYSAATHVRGRVAHYRIVEKLGEGGMGVVHLARDETLGRNVALKLLAPRLVEDVLFRERFVRESRLAAAIDHPNIIPVYEAGESGGRLFIAMRYVRGVDLRQLLAVEQQPLQFERAVTIVDQVARALDAAHREGLVHRDVKPGNVMIDVSEGREHCYLTDFGLTKNLASSAGFTETGGFLGTLTYMAPEQIEGRPLDSRADLYALGCVLFECLTGEVPFRRDSDVALMYAHLHEPPPSACAARPELPAAVDTVLARALAKAPTDRYATCADMVAGMRAALAGSAVGEFTPSSPSTGRRFSRPAVAPPSDVSTNGSPPPRAAPAHRHATPPPPRRPRPPATVRQPPRAQPPRQHDDDGERSYLRAAAIVAVAILVCAGGIAAALILRHSSGSTTSADQQAQQRLLERTVRLDHELLTLSTKLRRDNGRANAATKRRLAADRRQAGILVADARQQQASSAGAARSLTTATDQLQKAANGLTTYVASRRRETIVVVVDRLGTATQDVNTASHQIAADGPSRVSTPTVSIASLPARSVQLPGGALAAIEAPSFKMINSVGNAGDANGDGHPDFVVMTSTGDGGTPQAFVLFSGQGGDVKLDSLGDRGFVIDGAIRVAPAGDVNGDQRQDLAVVGPWDPLGLASSVYVVYGQDSPAKVDLSQLGTQGREIQLPMSNETSVGAGVQDIRAAGDVNNDGTDDVVVGDPAASSGAGRVWVVFGSDTATAPVSLDSIGSDGFEIRGDSGPGFGGSVSQAGDVNGDSIDDLIIGSPNHHDGIAQLGSGVAWVLYGSDSPTDVDLSKQLPADKGFRISTTEATAQVGDVVAGIGDVNQDQLADFLVTAPRSSPNGRNGAGAAYVIFGSRDGSEVVLDQLGSRGYAIQGPTRARKPNDRFPGGLGSSAASAGDVNGDGVPDVVLGSPGIRAPGAIAYVVFGDGGTGTVDLADPGGRALAIGSDTTLPGDATPVAGDADFDGDGQPDVLIGPVDGASGSSKAYVVSGTR